MIGRAAACLRIRCSKKKLNRIDMRRRVFVLRPSSLQLGDHGGRPVVESRKLNERAARTRVTFFPPPALSEHQPEYRPCICQHCGLFGLAVLPAKEGGAFFLCFLGRARARFKN